MSKSTLIKIFKHPYLTLLTIVLLVVLGSLVRIAIAAWTEPTADPPDDNVEAPINESETPQAKIGDFGLGQVRVDDGSGIHFNINGYWQGVSCIPYPGGDPYLDNRFFIDALDSLQIRIDKDDPDHTSEGSPGDFAANFVINNGNNEEIFRLDEAGNAWFKGIISFFGGDLAEGFQVADLVEPGDVLVIDETQDDVLKLSSKPFDTKVAGIVSTNPAVKLGKDRGVQVALTGTVPCKVVDEGGIIKRGDLLTTSSVPGHAMKCADPLRCLGAILGKALEEFTGESGVIKVLVGLQ